MTPFTYKCEKKSRTELQRKKIKKTEKNFWEILPVKMAVKILNWRFEQVRIVRKKFRYVQIVARKILPKKTK